VREKIKKAEKKTLAASIEKYMTETLNLNVEVKFSGGDDKVAASFQNNTKRSKKISLSN